MKKPVVALATHPSGQQGWKCSVCGAQLWYAQPIEFKKMLTLLGDFLANHQHLQS